MTQPYTGTSKIRWIDWAMKNICKTSQLAGTWHHNHVLCDQLSHLKVNQPHRINIHMLYCTVKNVSTDIHFFCWRTVTRYCTHSWYGRLWPTAISANRAQSHCRGYRPRITWAHRSMHCQHRQREAEGGGIPWWHQPIPIALGHRWYGANIINHSHRLAPANL